MIQEIAPYVFDNSFTSARAPREGDLLVRVKGKKVLVNAEGELCLPAAAGAAEKEDYLFSVSGTAFFRGPDVTGEPEEGTCLLDCGGLCARGPGWMAYACCVAAQLCSWYDANRFCGRCGERTRKDEKERMLRCPSCGNLIYPRLNPVVITAVTDGDRLLLTQYAGRATTNRYALIAGFAEIGESIEDTVRREVFEETGVRVKNIRFYRSQPWPHSDSLLFGFVCDLDGPDAIRRQEDELGFAGWIRREEIPDNGNTVSLTSEMIRRFKAGTLD